MFAFSLIMTATRIQKGALNRAEKSQRYGTDDILDLGLDKEMLAELKWELRTSGVAAYRVGVMRFFGSLPTNFCTHFPRKHPILNFVVEGSLRNSSGKLLHLIRPFSVYILVY